MKYQLVHLVNEGNPAIPTKGGHVFGTPNYVVVEDSIPVGSRDDAAEYVRKYRESHTDHVYYYKVEYGPHGVWHVDGTITYGGSSVDNWFADKIAILKVSLKRHVKKGEPKDPLQAKVWRIRRNGLVKRIAELRKKSNNKFYRAWVGTKIAICDWCGWCLKDKWIGLFKDWRWKRRQAAYFKKNHHSITESWALDMHMLADLKWNLKRLLDESCGIPTQFFSEVVKEEHKDDPDFDINAWFNSNCKLDEPGLEEKAVQRMRDVYNNIIRLINVYAFYSWQDIDDIPLKPEEITDEMVDPIMDCTFDEIDYETAEKKAKEAWDGIWELVKQYGRCMGD